MQVERKILCTVDHLAVVDWSIKMAIISKLASYQLILCLTSRGFTVADLKHTHVTTNMVTTTDTDSQHCQLRILNIIVYLKPKSYSRIANLF